MAVMNPRQLSTVMLLATLGKLRQAQAPFSLMWPLIRELARRRRISLGTISLLRRQAE
jgi:hypothetical protein